MTLTPLSPCSTVALCHTASGLWVRLNLMEATGTHGEYLVAYRLFWGHTCGEAA